MTFVEPFWSFSSRGHSNSDPALDSTSHAAPSIHQQSALHSPPPPIIIHPGRDGPGNPDDDPNDPDYHPDDGPDDKGHPDNLMDPLDDLVLALTQAIHALAHSNQCSGDSTLQTKVHEPDTFDGSNPKNLHEFLVNVQSYLKGMALAWFKLDLLNLDDYLNCPLWMDNHCEFLHELTTNFGPHDAAADAIQHLENLTMKDSLCIVRYLVEFNHWASQVKDYGEGTLRHRFYLGLPDHIKDEVSCVGKPATLHALHELAQTVDACYWECKSEVSHSAKPPAERTPLRTSDSKLKPSTSSSTPKSDSKKAKAPKSDINHLLRKDGKLTAAEWLRHLTGLCLFCGEPSHSTKDCPKSTSHAAKAHAAKAATLTALPVERSEPKN
ncbi:hypothetical protein M404DRAFT_17733 [Pisolithus tinctorius Marx 270]|uniref:CCHC-type domain-containing protein n=1 Tax=Pisolithus tinctorius Marx 270 TaxID=870435 RepID=A0A0C3KZK7_PISTI|nr:hypothetical protein M404DRAFT_17733 [Pisolithus tinctorius Marx 270]